MPLITVNDASVRYGLSDGHLRALLGAGTVKGQKFANAWALDERSLKRYLATERKRGPKPKKKSERKGLT